MKWIFLFSAGLFAGIIGGMGMGGGTLLIPILNICFGVPQHAAQALNLIGFVPMAVVALIIHAKNGLVDKRGLWKIVLSGLVFCAAGCFLARSINGEILRRIFGGFLVILSVLQTVSELKKKSR